MVETLGDHLRVKRIEAGLTQEGVAKLLGVAPASVVNWESNATDPVVRYYPRIADFLGYCPWTPAETVGARIRQARMFRGLSAAALAAEVGVCDTTVAAWEEGTAAPAERHCMFLCSFLGVSLTG